MNRFRKGFFDDFGDIVDRQHDHLVSVSVEKISTFRLTYFPSSEIEQIILKGVCLGKFKINF